MSINILVPRTKPRGTYHFNDHCPYGSYRTCDIQEKRCILYPAVVGDAGHPLKKKTKKNNRGNMVSIRDTPSIR